MNEERELLIALLKHFYIEDEDYKGGYKGGLTWRYREGVSLADVDGSELNDKLISFIKANNLEGNM